jgi:hypothetical protein
VFDRQTRVLDTRKESSPTPAPKQGEVVEVDLSGPLSPNAADIHRAIVNVTVADAWGLGFICQPVTDPPAVPSCDEDRCNPILAFDGKTGVMTAFAVLKVDARLKARILNCSEVMSRQMCDPPRRPPIHNVGRSKDRTGFERDGHQDRLR